MSFYLLPIMGHLEEVEGSAFRYSPCPRCRNPVRRQQADLVLRFAQGSGDFSTTMDGDLVARRAVADAIRGVEPSVVLRRVVVRGAPNTWLQVIASKCVELSDSSLRSPREQCPECGGVARVQYGDYPPLAIRHNEGCAPFFAHICGAPLLTVFSAQVFEVLAAIEPEFTAAEVLLVDNLEARTESDDAADSQ